MLILKRAPSDVDVKTDARCYGNCESLSAAMRGDAETSQPAQTDEGWLQWPPQ